MRFPTVLLLLILSASCGGGSAAPQPDGPITMGVLSGNNQTAVAAHDVALPLPIVAQVVRQANGQVSLRILDALLPPKAYAQTSVVGVPNQVVCASSPDPQHALRPEVACANSDAQGRATFVFHSDTVAGIAKAQVAAALATGTKITDSVSATVTPLAASGWILPNAGTALMNAAKVGVLFNLRDSVINVVDRYNNYLPRASYLIRYRRISFVCHTALVNGSCPGAGYDMSASDSILKSADTLTLRPGDLQIDVAVDSVVHAGIRVQYVP